MESERVRPWYSQGRYGVVPSRESDIVAMSVLQIRLPRRTMGRRHPRRLPQNADSVEEHGDDLCGSEPSLEKGFRLDRTKSCAG